jgi:hypothetical protein
VYFFVCLVGVYDMPTKFFGKIKVYLSHFLHQKIVSFVFMPTQKHAFNPNFTENPPGRLESLLTCIVFPMLLVSYMAKSFPGFLIVFSSQKIVLILFNHTFNEKQKNRPGKWAVT